MTQPLHERIRTMHWLFNPGDSRREDVRAIADEVERMQERIRALEALARDYVHRCYICGAPATRLVRRKCHVLSCKFCDRCDACSPDAPETEHAATIRGL